MAAESHPEDESTVLVVPASVQRESEQRYQQIISEMSTALWRSSIFQIVLVIIVLVSIFVLLRTSQQRSQEMEHLRQQGDQQLEILEILRNRDVLFREMIITIDCNNREALQDVIEQIEPPPGITVVTPECAEDTEG